MCKLKFAIEQNEALQILRAIDRYARTGSGHVKVLLGKFEGLLRLRVGQYRTSSMKQRTVSLFIVFAIGAKLIAEIFDGEV